MSNNAPRSNVWSTLSSSEPPATPAEGRDRPITEAVSEVAIPEGPLDEYIPMEQEASGFFNRLWTKTKEDPIVPIGTVTTIGVLTAGVLSMGKGDQARQQKLMRARVGAQAVTIAACVYALIKMADRKKNAQENQGIRR